MMKSQILFPAALAISALAHIWIASSARVSLDHPAAEATPAETTEILLVEELPPQPTPEPTPAPTPEPTPEPIPEPILDSQQNPESTTPPPPPTPIPTPTPAPTPKPTPKAIRPVPPSPKRPATPDLPAPVAIRNTPPAYPELARSKGWEGRAIIRAEVSAEGRALSVSIASSSGYGVLDQSALRAVKSWRFRPRTIAGVPTAGTVEVPVNFSLNR